MTFTVTFRQRSSDGHWQYVCVDTDGGIICGISETAESCVKELIDELLNRQTAQESIPTPTGNYFMN